MKLLVAIDENKELNSKLSAHFGHCPFFAIYETDSEKLEIIKNKIDQSNQSLTPVDQIMNFKPNIVFSLGIGQRAIKLFNEKNVKVKTGDFKILKQVIENIDNLKELEQSCEH